MSNSTATVFPALAARADRDDVSAQLAEVNRKLDQLSVQMSHMYRRTLALEELKDELSRIGRDAMAALTVELAQIEHEFNTDEIIHLARKLLRSTPRLIRLFEALESFDGLTTDLTPLSKEMLRDIVDRLQVAEDRGYFRLVQGGVSLFDRVADHYTQDDIDRLSDNVVFILDTVKRMTQPEILGLANNTIAAIDGAVHKPPKRLGFFGLLRALRDPDVQQGLGLSVDVLKQVAQNRAVAAESTEQALSDNGSKLLTNESAKE